MGGGRRGSRAKEGGVKIAIARSAIKFDGWEIVLKIILECVKAIKNLL